MACVYPALQLAIDCDQLQSIGRHPVANIKWFNIYLLCKTSGILVMLLGGDVKHCTIQSNLVMLLIKN